MQIQSVRHKGLKRFIEDDDDRGIRGDLIGRVRNVLTVLIAAADMDGVQGPPGWRIHPLSGERAGTWSISVSGNWRITFDIDGDLAHQAFPAHGVGLCLGEVLGDSVLMTDDLGDDLGLALAALIQE